MTFTAEMIRPGNMGLIMLIKTISYFICWLKFVTSELSKVTTIVKMTN